MFVPRPLSVLLVLPLFFGVMWAEEGPLLVNKCCPLGQELNDMLDKCLPIENTQEPKLEKETVQQFRERVWENVTFPSWMDNTSMIYDPDTGDVLNENFGYLQNASGEAIIRYGHRPCDVADTVTIWPSNTNYKLFANGSLQFNVSTILNGEEDPTDDQVLLPPEEWCSDTVASESSYFKILICPCKRVTCVNRCCTSGHLLVSEELYNRAEGWCEDRNGVVDHTPTFYEGRCYVAGPQVDSTNITNADTNTTTEIMGDQVDVMWNSSLDKEVNPTLRMNECKNTALEAITYTIIYLFFPTCGIEYNTVILNSIPTTVQSPWRTWLQHNGSLLLENDGRNRSFERHHVCLERGVIIDNRENRTESEELDNAIFCNRTYAIKYYIYKDYIRGIFSSPIISERNIYFRFLRSLLFLIGCLFLLLTLVAHALVPALGRSPFVKALCCHCTALLVASVTISTTNLLPELMEPFCSIIDKIPQLAYNYGPIAILLVANLLLFGMTVCRIQIAKKGTSILRRGSANACAKGGSNTNARRDVAKKKTSSIGITGWIKKPFDDAIDRKQLAVFAKLFLLMGYTCSTEFISWLTQHESNVLFYVIDSINLLRGFIIFLLFCWKPAVVNPLRARTRALGRRLGFSSADDGQCNVNSATMDSVLSLSETSDPKTDADRGICGKEL